MPRPKKPVDPKDPVIRKLVDLNESVVVDLTVLAAKNNPMLPVKLYMEKVLIDHANKKKK